MTAFELVVVPILLAMLVICGYIARKVFWINRQAFEFPNLVTNSLVQQFQQRQILENLITELGFERGLPPTRGWAASPDFLQVLSTHVRANRPQVIVECGSGVSTIVLARCLQLNRSGRVYSIDHDPEFAAETSERLRDYGLDEWATVVTAPLRPVEIDGKSWRWYQPDKIPETKIDLLVVDGPPMPVGPLVRYPAGPLLLPHVNRGGFVFLDDANRPDEEEIVRMWQAAFGPFKKSSYRCEKGCIALQRDS